MSKRVAVYGGSFNPPHVGHVLAVAYALATQPIDEVLVVPCFVHPFAKELAPFEQRFAMCKLAMGWLPGVEISRVEEALGGESRTLRTLSHLKAEHPGWQLRLLVGADILGDAPKWHGFEQVVALAPLLVLGRAGTVDPSAPAPLLPEVSSTQIRRLFAEGDTEALSALLPRRVLAFAQERGLYGWPSPGDAGEVTGR